MNGPTPLFWILLVTFISFMVMLYIRVTRTDKKKKDKTAINNCFSEEAKKKIEEKSTYQEPYIWSSTEDFNKAYGIKKPYPYSGYNPNLEEEIKWAKILPLDVIQRKVDWFFKNLDGLDKYEVIQYKAHVTVLNDYAANTPQKPVTEKQSNYYGSTGILPLRGVGVDKDLHEEKVNEYFDSLEDTKRFYKHEDDYFRILKTKEGREVVALHEEPIKLGLGEYINKDGEMYVIPFGGHA